MEEIKFLFLNALISFIATAAGVMLMTSTDNYTYLFLVVVAAIVGIRDLLAAMTMYDEQ